MKKLAFISLILICASATAFGQCVTGNPGTNCNGPVSISPPSGNTTQSAIVLTDLGSGATAPSPQSGNYSLSIVNGIIQESDNGGFYHPLLGPIGPQGPQGATGPAGPQGSQGQQGSQGPTGPAGPAGSAATISVGTTTTGAPGSQAQVTNSGSNSAAVFNFVIPQGIQGIIGPQGPQGNPGPQGTQGPSGQNGTSFTWRGEWNSNSSYAVNDVIAYGGSSYLCLVASGPGGQPPDQNTAAWSLMAQAGAVGPTGPAGPNGPTGPQGPAGPLLVPFDYAVLIYTGGSVKTGMNDPHAPVFHNNIDLSFANQTRIVVPVSLPLPSGSYVKLQYFSGSAWYDLTTIAATDTRAVATSTWAAIPSGALGVHEVRPIIYNNGTSSAPTTMSVHLQIK